VRNCALHFITIRKQWGMVMYLTGTHSMGNHTSQTRQSPFKVGSWCVPPCTCMSSKILGTMWFSAPESVEITFNVPLIEFIRSIVQGRVWAIDLAGSVQCSGTTLHSDLVLYSTSKKNSLSVPLYMLSVLWLLWEGCQGKAYLSFMWSDPHWKEHSCTGQGTTRYANSYI